MKRNDAARLGKQTVFFVEQGFYEVNSVRVPLREWTDAAVAGTTNYPGHDPVPTLPDAAGHETRFEVHNQRTLAAAQRFAVDGANPVALNFASARNPGGGFLGGARAQEESLARSSALYACLVDQPMYDHHRELRDPMYTSWVIHSPAVPVIRDDDGYLLAKPYRCAFITSPAANAGVVLERKASRADEIEVAMRDRVDRVLAVAAHHGHETLVLGAWGCGVFRNDPEMIARLFADALLTGRFANRFAHVMFAVLDATKTQHIIKPFMKAFPRT